MAMENKKVNGFKIFASILFAILILGAYGYVIWKGEPWGKNYLSYGAIGLCFAFSLIFLTKNSKKVFITLALACNVAADYFLVFAPSEKHKLIGLCVFLGMQLFYFCYTLAIQKSNVARAINFALRLSVCLAAILLLPRYATLKTIELLAVIYIANSLVTLFVMLCHFKTEWLAFFGMLLFILCDVCVGLTNGGIEFFHIPAGKFVEFITTHDVAFWFYTPGVFLISLSSVWAKNKK